MKKFKKALSGMTLVEVLVAMTIFTVMFMMVFGTMILSVRLNAETRTYDVEIDQQVVDVERYNPMGAYIEGLTDESPNIEDYEGSAGTGKKTLNFSFGGAGQAITIDGYAYEAMSRDENNGFSLKFFSSTRPDLNDKKCWIRVINVSSEDNKNIYLYLPAENSGEFYVKNGNKPYSKTAVKTVPRNQALSIGFDFTNSDDAVWVWVTTQADMSQVDLVSAAVTPTFLVINKTNCLTGNPLTTKMYMDSNGYIDIYYTDAGFMNAAEYKESLSADEP